MATPNGYHRPIEHFLNPTVKCKRTHAKNKEKTSKTERVIARGKEEKAKNDGVAAERDGNLIGWSNDEKGNNEEKRGAKRDES